MLIALGIAYEAYEAYGAYNLLILAQMGASRQIRRHAHDCIIAPHRSVVRSFALASHSCGDTATQTPPSCAAPNVWAAVRPLTSVALSHFRDSAKMIK